MSDELAHELFDWLFNQSHVSVIWTCQQIRVEECACAVPLHGAEMHMQLVLSADSHK